MVLNGLFLLGRKFPRANEETIIDNGAAGKKKFIEEPVFKKEGLALIIMGFNSNTIFMGFQTWSPTYAQHVLGINQISSLKFSISF